MSTAPSSRWLFSPTLDLWAFVAPVVLAFVLVAVGVKTGIARTETPPAVWLFFVLGVDVAHVWATGFRVYADPVERARRRWLYFGAPALCYMLGVAVHLTLGSLTFWRGVAYLAVFHFVRQQYGWVRLYRRRAGEEDRLGAVLDFGVIYLATLYPLAVWHAGSPRAFHWLIDGDFVLGLSPQLPRVLGALYAAFLTVYLARLGLQAWRRQPISWGKQAVVAGTAACWYVGIVLFDSDFVFTVTNVLIHGIPYFILIWVHARARLTESESLGGAVIRMGAAAFYAVLVAVAFLEEGLWDGVVWHDHPQFFGDWNLAPSAWVLGLTVPLLALPQLTHYLLDGFIWRRSQVDA